MSHPPSSPGSLPRSGPRHRPPAPVEGFRDGETGSPPSTPSTPQTPRRTPPPTRGAFRRLGSNTDHPPPAVSTRLSGRERTTPSPLCTTPSRPVPGTANGSPVPLDRVVTDSGTTYSLNRTTDTSTDTNLHCRPDLDCGSTSTLFPVLLVPLTSLVPAPTFELPAAPHLPHSHLLGSPRPDPDPDPASSRGSGTTTASPPRPRSPLQPLS